MANVLFKIKLHFLFTKNSYGFIKHQKEDKILSFQNFLADSKELLDSFDRINTNSSFLNFKSDDIKTTVLDFLMEHMQRMDGFI